MKNSDLESFDSGKVSTPISKILARLQYRKDQCDRYGHLSPEDLSPTCAYCGRNIQTNKPDYRAIQKVIQSMYPE